MNKLYNTQENITSNFTEIILKIFPDIRKTQLNILPSILFGMIISESCVPIDIASSLKDKFCLVKLDSVVKRINRFFNNQLFDPYLFYKHIISYVISNYKKKHQDKRVHISFDHMFSRDNYTVFMLSMRIGKQGIPLWFKCFKDINSEAFKINIIKQGLSEVSNLFKNTDFELIFLADRFFGYPVVMEHINFLGHTYCIRLKSNLTLFHYVKKEGHIIREYISNISGYKYKSKIYENCYITDKKYKTTVVFSDCSDVDEAWVIATNGDPRRAIKDYSYRFGSIECLFKNQKTNGFNLEKISNASIDAFTTMYSLICTCVLFLTILGADYSKNTKCYKNEKIITHKIYKINGKNIKKRIMSLFNTGLKLFKRAFNSPIYIRITFNFILYDI